VKRIVIALGGNALEKRGLPPTAESQLQAIKETVTYIADIIEDGYEVIISHGNGPQVGRILLATEASAAITPAMPFDVCGAMSQGYIGYQLQLSLGTELRKRGLEKPVATIITQVTVDQNDPGFKNPAKPIGPFYTKEEADKIAAEKGYAMKEDSGRGYRRVVASPLPVKIMELNTIKTLVEAGSVCIACGGGGIPAVEECGALKGVPAVIDKDFASAKLAEDLDAAMLVILTEVDKVCLNFNTEKQQQLDAAGTAEMQKYADEGHFAPGAMLPKVLASIKFAGSKKGRTAVIASLAQAKGALNGTAGTRICD
jgi:carbamate kinase